MVLHVISLSDIVVRFELSTGLVDSLKQKDERVSKCSKRKRREVEMADSATRQPRGHESPFYPHGVRTVNVCPLSMLSATEWAPSGRSQHPLSHPIHGSSEPCMPTLIWPERQ